MNINLKQLEAFCALVEYKNFTKASEALFLSQSTISSHVHTLEKEMGVQLASRNYRRKIEITADGEILVAASTIPAQYILPGLMAQFLKENFNIHFSLEKGDSMAVMEMLKQRKVRVGFLGTKEVDGPLEFQVYCKDYLVLVTPNTEKYRQLQFQKKLGRELLKEPLILRTKTSGTMKEFERYLKEQKIEEQDLNVVARINDPETIKNAVISGIGVTVMSNLAVREEAGEGKLLKFELDQKRFSRCIYTAYLKETRLTDLEKQFLEPPEYENSQEVSIIEKGDNK